MGGSQTCGEWDVSPGRTVLCKGPEGKASFGGPIGLRTLDGVGLKKDTKPRGLPDLWGTCQA